MISILRRVLCQALVLCAASSALALDPPAYVLALDETYKWSAKTTSPLEGAEVTVLRLTSQTWQGMKWRHWMHVIKPAKISHPDQALLVIAGGRSRKEEPGPNSMEVGLLRDIAIRTGSIIAVVGQIPNQPIFDGKSEDEIIAYTFQQFLETKDESWPALLPMTKAAMRAMDATQAFAKERYDIKLEKFVVTGASKRGWTTWLTAAFDNRVEAIAPMVIDTLNFERQMPLQLESFGKFSEQIKDYTELDLPKRMQTEEGKRLVQLIDPYAYLDKLTMPKLIVLGTNDRYWPVDAAKMYFGDLKGEKHIHEVPNAGHGLGAGVIEAVTAFYLDVLDRKARPNYAWKTAVTGEESVTTLTATDLPVKVELWTATSASRDFRDAKWSGEVIPGDDGRWEARVKLPEKGFAAYHLRMTFEGSAGQEYALSTNVEVIGAKP
ncbi:MAG: PhoPQ-activated protein PqaA family protein [Planctomycetota bacterium]